MRWVAREGRRQRYNVHMSENSESPNPRVACDAMCGGLARWLRVLGVDASYTPDIEDGELVRQALAERRLVISSDSRLFERRVFASGALRGFFLPRGLRLRAQVRHVIDQLALRAGFPRCTLCNGELVPVRREEVAGEVPARSLIWTRAFYRCQACGHVFWQGTHWERIQSVLQAAPASETGHGPDSP